MYPSPRPTRRLNLLLLAALVHYVNACPCGCLEHHALLHAVTTAMGGNYHEHDEHPTSPPGTTLALDGHRCDDCHGCYDCEDVVFATSRNGSVSQDMAVDVELLPAILPIAPTFVTLQGERLRSIANANAALGVCAELAVLQI